MVKVYSLTVRNRAAATALGVGVVALGVVFLTLGFALLLGLVVAGGIVGAGVAAYRLLRGGNAARKPLSHIDMHSAASAGLDPSLEVKPAVKAIVRPRAESD